MKYIFDVGSSSSLKARLNIISEVEIQANIKPRTPETFKLCVDKVVLCLNL